jgi:hypothetical protein
MNRARLASGSLIAVLCVALTGGRVARADAPALQGVFVNAAQPEQGIDAAIDAAVRSFNVAARAIARSRLKRVNVALNRVEVARHDAEITITLGSNTPSTATPGHGPAKWTRDDGEIVDVTLEWQGATLVQTVTSGESKRVNRFDLSPDGNTLTLAVTVTGPQLQTPVQYQLTFRREGAR